jgi:hypothetical protein
VLREVNRDFKLTTTFGFSNEYRDTAVSVWVSAVRSGASWPHKADPARRRCPVLDKAAATLMVHPEVVVNLNG